MVARSLGEQRTEHMVKNRYKTILTKQKKILPSVNNEKHLLMSFINPNLVEKYRQKELRKELPPLHIEEQA